MYETLIMQTINDFTCSLTNHNAWWLNIYNDGMLYLANTEYLCIFSYATAGVCMGEDFGEISVALVFTLTLRSP